MSELTEPVNIGNPNELTILQLAKMIINLTGSKSEIIYKDLPVDDPKIRRPDITKAQKYLNWEPSIELHDGLQKTIEYFARLSHND